MNIQNIIHVRAETFAIAIYCKLHFHWTVTISTEGSVSGATEQWKATVCGGGGAVGSIVSYNKD